MGVRELLKLLKSKVKPEVLKLEVQDDAELILMVDFQPFCFWILGSFEDEVSSWDFDAVSQRAATFIKRLRCCGVSCCFVDDGARGSGGVEEMEAKLEEWKARAKEIVQKVVQKRLYLEGSAMKPAEIQRCGLFTMAVRQGLESVGVKLKRAEGEADPVLAMELMKPRTIGILGNDTDFVLMKHGRFIHLELLDPSLLLEDEPSAVALPIWTRKKLAAVLKVSEEILPMAAALCGNDHSKGLIEECRGRGWTGPDGLPVTDSFAQLALLLQKANDGGCQPEVKALEMLKPALPKPEDFNRAAKVLANVQSFYAPGSVSRQEKMDSKVEQVRKEVQVGLSPKWSWPLAAYGIFYVSRILEEPGLNSHGTALLLELRSHAFGLLAPSVPVTSKFSTSRLQVRLLGAVADSDTFQDGVKLVKTDGDVFMARKWVPKLRKQWLQDAVEGEGSPNRSWDSSYGLTTRELHLLALRYTLRFARRLKVTVVELEALICTAWLLMSNLPWVSELLAESSSRAGWRCLSLSAWYQELLIAILELAQLMHVAPKPEASASELFHGQLFLCLLGFFHRHPDVTSSGCANGTQCPSRRGRRGKMGPRMWIDGEDAGSEPPTPLSPEQELQKLRGGQAYGDWREEVLRGLDLEELHDTGATVLGITAAAAVSAASAAAKSTGSTALPIEEHKEKLCNTLMTSRVVCVHGETGSGKSTQVPQYILELFPEAQIAVTQPRRMAAVNLAKRVAKERNEELGEAVGYRIGGDSVVGKRLNFQTTGWLLRALVSNQNRLGKLTHVVFDEIHERSADADFLSLVARLLLHRYPEVRLVIMSATLQADLFRVYFRELQYESVEVPLVAVGGQCHEVEKIFLDDLKDYCKEGLSSQGQSLVRRLCQKFQEQQMGQKKSQALTDYATSCSPLILDLLAFLATSGCTILVFLPGLQEITNIYDECQTLLHAQDGTALSGAASSGASGSDEDGKEELKESRRNFKMKFKVFAMHSQIPMEDQAAVFQAPEEGVCHFVLASNVAESSLTLPNVCAVVDLGMNKQQVYDHRLKMTYLALKWTSKASAHQRAGRAGRTRKGVVVRLYTQDFYHKELQEFDRPETAVLPLPRLYLQAKQLAKDLATAEEEEDARNGWGKGKDAGSSVASCMLSADAAATACSVLRGLVDPPDLTIIEASRNELAQGWALETAEEQAEMTSIGRVCLSLPFDLSLSRLVWLSIQWGCVVDGVVLACSLAVPDPFSTPTLFAFPDLTVLGPKLRRSNLARKHFDGGLCSQPLALWQLFQEFWRTFPTESKRDGRKGWLKHAHFLAHSWAVIPRRLAEFVAQVDEVAQRLVGILKQDSPGQKKLYGLLEGLGRQSLSTVATEFTDDANFQGATPWDEEEAAQMGQTKEEKMERTKQQKKKLGNTVFEKEVDMLRALLAASFSDRLLTTARKPAEAKRCMKSFRRIWEMGVQDPRRCAVLKLPDVGEFPGGIPKLVQLMLATDRKVEIRGMLDEEQILVELQGAEADREVDPEEQTSMPCDLQDDLHILNQLTRGKSGVCQVDLAKMKTWGQKVEEPKVVQFNISRPSHPCQLTWEVHAAAEDDQKGRNSSVRKGIPDAHSPIGFICHVPRGLRRPLGRAVTGHVDVTDTDVHDGDGAPEALLESQALQAGLDSPWYGCCSLVQYTQGSICFISGLTVLHPQHLKFLLLTADPQHSNLALLLNDALTLKALRLHRKEIPMEVSFSEMQTIDRFRKTLRESMADGSSLCESPMLEELRQFCTSLSGAVAPPPGLVAGGGDLKGKAWANKIGAAWVQPAMPATAGELRGMQPLMPERGDRLVEVLQSILRIMHNQEMATKSKALWKQLRREFVWKNKTQALMETVLKNHPHLFLRDGQQWKLLV